ncbi:hypothetical protein D9619_011159 [Psilocybe cf. subviscida]|uniref:Cystathionine gamma-lyase n=1 Tax=Psilocybe cf. subviscida TaxID=2480587 RepID=A0A8H5BIU2_9AGAR|nr:hypothetical protein D9619_011159 [Psilocybe cf. subviscida]
MRGGFSAQPGLAVPVSLRSRSLLLFHSLSLTLPSIIRLDRLASFTPTDSLLSAGYEYSRSGNPNRNLLERTLVSLESSPAQSNVALAFSSGSSTTSADLSSMRPNAHIVSVNDV